MLKFGATKVAKEEFYGAKTPLNISDVNVDNIVISKLVVIKNNFKYLIGYLDETIRPLVLILTKISRILRHLKLKMDMKIRIIN